MNKSVDMWAFTTGVVVGVLTMVAILSFNHNLKDSKEYRNAKMECELSLPRDRQCVMYFKPEADDE